MSFRPPCSLLSCYSFLENCAVFQWLQAGLFYFSSWYCSYHCSIWLTVAFIQWWHSVRTCKSKWNVEVFFDVMPNFEGITNVNSIGKSSRFALSEFEPKTLTTIDCFILVHFQFLFLTSNKHVLKHWLWDWSPINLLDFGSLT